MTGDDESNSARQGIPGQIRQQLHATWGEVDASKPGVPTSLKREFASLTVAYYRSLRPHRREEAVKDDWRDGDIHWLRDIIGDTVTVSESAPGFGGGEQTTRVPAIQTASIEQIESVAYSLDDIAKKLGVTEAVKSRTPHTEATMDDLRGLLKARGQTQALENLPGESGETADGGEA